MKTFVSSKEISRMGKIMLPVFMLLIHYSTQAQILNCNAHFIHQPGSGANSIYFSPYTNPVGATYNWAFGDGGTANISNPVHTYAPGNYLACLSVSVPAGPNTLACTATFCDSIHVSSTTVVCNASFSMQPGSAANSIHFSNSVNPTGTIYVWHFGDGSTASNAAPTHVYTPGNYQVCLTVTVPGTGGTILCAATHCDSVHISPSTVNCNAHFTHQTSPSNANGVYFTGPTNNPAATAYSWNYGDGFTGTGGNSYHVYAAGNYLACLTTTVYGANNTILCTSTFCDSIHIAPTTVNCSAVFTHHHSGTNSSVENFTGAINPAGTIYNWSFGDGSSGAGVSPTHNYAPGNYLACLTVIVPGLNGAALCTTTYCDSVRIAPVIVSCNAHFTRQPGPALNSFYFIGATNIPGTQYAWTFGDGGTGNTANAYHIYAAGHYKVCLTVTVFAAGSPTPICTATFCDSIHIVNVANCLADFSYMKVANALRTYSFTNLSSAAATGFFWHFGDAATSTLANPVHQYATVGQCQVCITMFDSIHQCSNTKCKTITVSTAINASVSRDGLVGLEMDDMLNSLTVNIFPNPSSNKTVLHIENAKSPVTFMLYDSTGKLSEQKTLLSNGDFELNNTNRAAGIYYYRVFGDESDTVSGKLILQK